MNYFADFLRTVLKQHLQTNSHRNRDECAKTGTIIQSKCLNAKAMPFYERNDEGLYLITFAHF